jgi:hypothetical protein
LGYYSFIADIYGEELSKDNAEAGKNWLYKTNYKTKKEFR